MKVHKIYQLVLTVAVDTEHVIFKIAFTLFDVTYLHLTHIFDLYTVRRNTGERRKYLLCMSCI